VAFLVFIFGAGAALAGYFGMKHGEPTAQREIRLPTPSPADQRLQSSPAPPLYSDPPDQPAKPELPAMDSASEKSVLQDSEPTADAAQTTRSSNAEPVKSAESNAVNVPKCNMRACERAYRSFDPDDCTYKPPNGPRRVCKK
jgi:hypothetical protein